MYTGSNVREYDKVSILVSTDRGSNWTEKVIFPFDSDNTAYRDQALVMSSKGREYVPMNMITTIQNLEVPNV